MNQIAYSLLMIVVALAPWVVVLRKARSRPDHQRTWAKWLLALPILLFINGGLIIIWGILAVYWFRHARQPPPDGIDEPEQNPFS